MSASEKKRYEMIPIPREEGPIIQNAPSKHKRSNIFLLFGFVAVLGVMAVASMESGTSSEEEEDTDNIFENSTSELCKQRVIGYHDLSSTDGVTDLQLSKLTHLILADIEIQKDGTMEFQTVEEKGRFKEIVKKSKKFPSLNVLFYLTSNENFKVFAQVLNNSEYKENLIDSITSFLVEDHLDGIDIDGAFALTKEEADVWTDFCGELRRKLKKLATSTKRKVPFIISAYWPSLPHENFDDIEKVVDQLDFVTVKTEDYYGSWLSESPEFTGPPSPLYSKKFPKKTVDNTMKEYSCLTKNPNKFNIQVDFVGQHWQNVIKSNDSSWMIAEPMNGQVRGGWLAWNALPESQWNISMALWNDESKTPYIWDSETRNYLAFENPKSLEGKTKYVVEKNIGGVAVWLIHRDDEESTMLSALSTAEFCAKSESNDVNYNCELVEKKTTVEPVSHWRA